MSFDFLNVTELAGDKVSREQVGRICHRYYWAGSHCRGKDVLEVACGTGQGAGYLKSLSKSYRAGDYSDKILAIARSHYGERVDFRQFDAQQMPFSDHSLDVIIIFEALYYIPSADRFVAECRRILRPNGKVLVATANKDLYDFNPSPHSTTYHGVVELGQMFARQGFSSEFFGNTPVCTVSWRQRVLRPIKKMAVASGIMPESKEVKLILKKLVFGGVVTMPAEISEGMIPYSEPSRLTEGESDRKFKVIYCIASL